MNKIIIKPSVYILSLSIFFLVCSCKNAPKPGIRDNSGSENNISEKKEQLFRLVQPESGSKFTCGEKISFILKGKGKENFFDSLKVSNGNTLLDFEINKSGIIVNTSGLNPGKHRLSLKLFLPDGNHENLSVSLEFLSDIVPLEYTYRVLKTYPHDINAYTQGLEFSEDKLLEGTGAYGESSLRKLDLKTGEILKFRNLPSDIFGEGITQLNGKIYQITYRAQVGFVYDARSFDQINKIYYQNKEGWGLCNNGENIIMSDGTNLIYFMDTTYFSVERKIEVYDNNGQVDLLNELELINGKLYANRYTTNEIVIIDPETGKLEGRIDMSGLLKEEDKHRRIDYFNGIAYRKSTGQIIVTGKYWPKLYEVEFVKK
jgi:glutaminyl-peptide cyclotransferase